MTLRRLVIAADARMEFAWTHTAHTMAAAFWAQGHRADVEDFLPSRMRQQALSEPVDLPFPTDRHRTIDKSRITVDEGE